MRQATVAILLALTLAAAGPSRPGWQVQYFFDEKDSTLAFSDIAFPSAQRGLAAGVISVKNSKKPVVLVTSNGGQTWTQTPGPDVPRSLYCLDETACWLTGTKGIWFSAESGRAWRRVLKDSDILTTYFTTPERGWALGAEKKLLETRDGGKTWTKVESVSEIKTSPERTVFYAIGFVNPKTGMIAGRSEPHVRDEDVPIWMDTSPELRHERPAVSILMDTKDGGETWSPSTASMFGRISRLGMSKGVGVGLGLIEFDRVMEYPSEVYRFDMRNGKNNRAFRRKDVAITDVAVAEDGFGLVAGIEPVGKVTHSPIPGKVRIFESPDLASWQEMDVDYRAVGHSVRAAVVDRDHMWLATDTGMVLRLTR